MNLKNLYLQFTAYEYDRENPSITICDSKESAIHRCLTELNIRVTEENIEYYVNSLARGNKIDIHEEIFCWIEPYCSEKPFSASEEQKQLIKKHITKITN